MNKVIHYCWFGKGPLSETAQRSIESWKLYAPDHEIVRWDESNAPLDACPFVRSAYAAGKWAFVSDYVRFHVLYECGGIYMDVGTELIKSIDPLYRYLPFSAIEESSKTATTGLIAACEAKDPVIAGVLAAYQDLDFVNDPEYLSRNTVNEMFTRELEKNGFVRADKMQRVAGWTLLPSEYFSPIYGFRGYHISQDTYSVHRSSGSWVTPALKVKKDIIRRFAPYIGKRAAEIVGRSVGEISCNGWRAGLSNLMGVVARSVKRVK